jgi:hypothetical protein
MALMLKTVRASQGSRWVGDALRLFARRPMAFTALALLPGAVATVLPMLPLVMAALSLFSLPLLSLGFMVAAQSALLDGPVHMRQFIEPLRGAAVRRNALLKLCAGYVLLIVLAALVASSLSAGAFGQLQALDRQSPDFSARAVARAPELSRGLGVMMLLYALISVPYWHAPALVHWGGQGARQALFSSTLALWRTRGALLVYVLSWAGLMLAMFMVAAVVGSLFGAQQSPSIGVAFAAVVLTAALYAVFYISALFCFNDTFGGALATPPAEEPLPPA